ncbi:hypothetical protein J6590_038625 [Homalodisca vitripennis]|nr:hypothetical protein J6590_038625 [Homalodisca vitripennis]
MIFHEKKILQVENVPLFTIEEFETSVRTLKSNKASGPNRSPSEALKKIFTINAGLLLRMYNAWLKECFHLPGKPSG